MGKVTKSCLMLSVMIVCALMAFSLSYGDILLQTGFEEDAMGENMPQQPVGVWEVSGGGFEISVVQVKEGSQSLGLVGGGGDQALAASIDTTDRVISAEFWVYVDGAARSLTFFLLGAESPPTDWGAAGPYINWNEEKMRHYMGAWEEIVPISSNEWRYIRVVADTEASTFAVYVGDTPSAVYASDPVGQGLQFRSEIAEPPAKVCFGTYGLASPAYIDGLLVYEGDEVPDIASVAPSGKLTSTWGSLKSR